MRSARAIIFHSLPRDDGAGCGRFYVIREFFGFRFLFFVKVNANQTKQQTTAKGVAGEVDGPLEKKKQSRRKSVWEAPILIRWKIR